MSEPVSLFAVGASWQVRLFGAFRLDARGANATPGSRKARALLAYLILTGGPVPRERLAELLWGDRGPDQARASLRQALYELRALAEGPAPLLRIDRTQAEAIRSVLVCDLDTLRSLGAQADAAGFAALIGEEPAELLADLDDIDPGFDDWLGGQRARRREERQTLGLAVGGRALAAGDPRGAARLAAALSVAEPFDEATVRLTLQARAALGDRSGARQAFRRYAEVMRDELGIEPAGDLVALEARLSADDLRAPGIEGDSADGAAGLAAPERGRRRWTILAGALGALAILGGLGFGAWRWFDGRTQLEVLRVEPLAAPASDGPAQALRVGLSADLARMVLGNDARLVVEDPHDPHEGTAAAARATYVITGEARSAGGLLHVNLRLLDGGSRGILWSQSFVQPEGDPDAARVRIAARAADVAICAEGGVRPPPRGIDAETLRLYLEGCEQKHGDWSLSARLLGETVRRRPDFAHAWAMLSAATAVSAPAGAAGEPAMQRAQAFARRALAIDPNEGEAYWALAIAQPGLSNWSRRLALLEEGHRREPGNANIDSQLAEELSVVGRGIEASPFAEAATQRDPFGRPKAAQLVALLGYGGQRDRAEALAEDALRHWPGDPLLRRIQLRIAVVGDDAANAQRWLDGPPAATGLSPAEAERWRAVLRVRRDASPDARGMARAAILSSIRKDDIPTMADGVMALTLIGDLDEAYALAATAPGRAFDGDGVLFYDAMAPFRSDARFMALAGHLGLVDIWRRTGRWPDFCRASNRPYDCDPAARAAGF